MEITLILAQFMSGLSRGMMLFLIASGLSLIFGVMNILNFAHATLWLAGAYFCYTFWYLMQGSGLGLWVAIPLAALSMAVGGGSSRWCSSAASTAGTSRSNSS